MGHGLKSFFSKNAFAASSVEQLAYWAKAGTAVRRENARRTEVILIGDIFII